MLARLAPLQGDAPAEQAAQAPDLASLPPDERAALAARQPPPTEPSFLGWCRSLGVEVPASPDSLTEALAHRAAA